MRRLLPILTALLLAACLALPASAAVRFVSPSAPTHAGETITFEWSGLPSQLHEVELEVSLEGGRWRRISPELDSRAGRYEWRVSSWASGQARVRLRAGGEHSEQVIATGAAFEVRSSLAHAFAHDDADGWWSLASADTSPLAQGIGAPVLEPHESAIAIVVDHSAPLLAPRSAGSRVQTVRRTLHTTPVRVPRDRCPTRVPLRI